MVIGNNLPALKTYLNMKKNDRLLSASTQRLSTGYKINSAKDDPAGLSIASKLSYQVSGLNKASENASNGVSMVQTAEGALSEVHNMLQRMRELAVQSANDTLTPDDRIKIQTEVDQLTNEISATADRTEYNKIKLLNGEANRVTSSHVNTGTGAYAEDKSIATVLYVSDNMSAGTLSYSILNVGAPAQVNGTARSPVPSDNAAVGTTGAGKITINGMDIEINASDSYGAVKTKIIETCGYAGMTAYDCTDGSVCLVSNNVGSNQYIEVTGDPALLGMYGLAPTTGKVTSTDAQISIDGMIDEAGRPVSNFNNSVAYSSDGNQVTITSTGGQIIKLNIQVSLMVDPTTNVALMPPVYTYGDGKTPAADGTSATGSQMQLLIKDYGPIMLQVGQNYNMAVKVQIPSVTAETMGFVEYKGGKMYPLLNYQTSDGSALALNKVDDAIQFISTIRSRLGAYQNRLESTIVSLDTAAENTESSRSRIQDTDMAREMTEYTQRNVIYQAGIAILGQANQRPQQIISLLK